MVGQNLQYNVGTVTYISDGGVNVGTVTYISDSGVSSNTSAIVGSTVAVFVVLAVVCALLIVVLVIFFKRRSAAKYKATLLANKYTHQEMTEMTEGSNYGSCTNKTISFYSQVFQM